MPVVYVILSIAYVLKVYRWRRLTRQLAMPLVGYGAAIVALAPYWVHEFGSGFSNTKGILKTITMASGGEESVSLPLYIWEKISNLLLHYINLVRQVYLWDGSMVAAAIAIVSKFLFKVEGKHFFNPANLGIIVALTFTQDAWVSPGQWGEEIWYALIFIGAGGIVLKRVGRWDTTAAFLGSYALLEALRNLYLGWTWDVWGHRLMSGSLLLFALFMVTDPRSIPNARPARLIWAGSIAALTFVLRNQFYLSTGVFWALFALSPLTVGLDHLWKAERFTWKLPLPKRLTAGA